MNLNGGREILSIPGPSIIPDRVIQAMSRPPTNIYSGPLLDMTDQVLRDLKQVARTEGDVCIYISNGHGAWEAALSNTLSRGDTVLVLESGRFALGWGEMAEKMGVRVEVLPCDPRDAVDPDAVEARLRADPEGRIKAVLVVQVDTASSVWNDIAAIRRAIDAAGHPALYMVDCIACLGSIEFHMDDWGVDVMVAGSQKGLMTPPGVAFTFSNAKAWAAHQTADLVTSYWNWTPRINPEIYYQLFAGTAPTQHIYGLKEALEILLREEGQEQTWARHRVLAEAVRACVAEWAKGGALEMNVTDPAHRCDVVTTVLTPGFDADAMRSLCESQMNLVLGVGLGNFAGAAFRIGHMGWLNPPMILGTLAATEAAFRSLGVAAPSGLAQAAEVVGAALSA